MKSFLLIKMRFFLKQIIEKLPPPEEHILSKMVNDRTILFGEIDDVLTSQKNLSVEEGRKLLAAQKYKKAYVVFQSITLRNSNARWAWHGLGDACQFMSCYDEALQSYRYAYDLSMKDFTSTEMLPTDKMKKERGLHLAGIANALTCLGSIEEAELIWKQVLEFDPALQWMKENAQNRKKNKDSIETFQKIKNRVKNRNTTNK